jgi:hypothetical protein
MNKHAVSMLGGAVVAMNVPTCQIGNTSAIALGPISPADASNLAVWLLVLTMLTGHEPAEVVLDRFFRDFRKALES